jgi:hypothetical protein
MDYLKLTLLLALWLKNNLVILILVVISKAMSQVQKLKTPKTQHLQNPQKPKN